MPAPRATQLSSTALFGVQSELGPGGLPARLTTSPKLSAVQPQGAHGILRAACLHAPAELSVPSVQRPGHTPRQWTHRPLLRQPRLPHPVPCVLAWPTKPRWVEPRPALGSCSPAALFKVVRSCSRIPAILPPSLVLADSWAAGGPGRSSLSWAQNTGLAALHPGGSHMVWPPLLEVLLFPPTHPGAGGGGPPAVDLGSSREAQRRSVSDLRLGDRPDSNVRAGSGGGGSGRGPGRRRPGGGQPVGGPPQKRTLRGKGLEQHLGLSSSPSSDTSLVPPAPALCQG